MQSKIVRIGCGSGFWGDTPEAVRPMFNEAQLDYLIFDYLAEVTMSILAKAKLKDSRLGYATDFVSQFVKPHAKKIADQKLKIVVNAGGVNPRSCVMAIEEELKSQGIALKVAAVLGDDLMDSSHSLFGKGVTEMYTDAPLPESVVSANAYLGAFPIAIALSEGADIVVTGRCVDSALALGPLIHEFGWANNQFDLLSAGSLVGHILECGPQVTGAFETDWRGSSATWATIGFPVAECRSDGTFVVTKPRGTGGAVTLNSVAEQISYETGDPAAYILPDVVCDWRNVGVEQVGEDRVRVWGAAGFPCTDTYKVSATYPDGYRCLATLLIRGMEAVPKAKAVASAILERTRLVFEREGFTDYDETSVECLGAEEAYGIHARTQNTREVVLKIGVRHQNQKALDVFAREIYPASTGTVQGVAGVFGGRPKVQQVVRLFSFLKLKKEVTPIVLMQGKEQLVDIRIGDGLAVSGSRLAAIQAEPILNDANPTVTVPLYVLAHARSGDKGNISNVAVLARDKAFLPSIAAQLTTDRVKEFMSQLVDGPVRRFSWPGLNGFNFLMDQALGGGGVSSLRYDPQGKSHAQILLEFPIRIPESWVTSGKVKNA